MGRVRVISEQCVPRRGHLAEKRRRQEAEPDDAENAADRGQVLWKRSRWICSENLGCPGSHGLECSVREQNADVSGVRNRVVSIGGVDGLGYELLGDLPDRSNQSVAGDGIGIRTGPSLILFRKSPRHAGFFDYPTHSPTK